jgi:tripartite-type tricarboxylate transporter receptor subunit TctC
VKVLTAVVSIACAALFIAVCHAQSTYPTKPVRIVVTFGGGGAAEIYSRLIGQHLTEMWGQQVLADPRPGANGIIATEIVARAPADGYTLLAGVDGTHTINPSFYRKLPYDAVRDFVPLTQMFLAPFIISVHPSMPVKNMKELAAFARARPGEVTFGSAGHGNAGHLAGELFAAMAGIKLTHVPYKGGAPAMTALLSGEIPLLFGNAANAMPLIGSGRLRAIAVSTKQRLPVLPNIPTIAESGFPAFEAGTWTGLFAPARTPPEIVAKIARDAAQVIRRSDVREHMQRAGLIPVGNTPQEFAAVMKVEAARYAELIHKLGIRAD